MVAGWTVDTTETHDEYVRVWFVRDGERTGVELGRNRGAPDDWSTEVARLMPAPGEEPPIELLQAAMGTVRTWEPVWEVRPPPPPPPAPPPWRPVWLVGNAVVGAIAVGLAGLRARAAPREGLAMALAVLGGLVAFAAGLAMQPEISRVGALHEGASITNLRHLAAIGAHTGPNFTGLVRDLGGGAADIRDLVRVNTAFVLAGLVLAVPALRAAAGSWPAAVLFTGLLGWNRLSWGAATSELPAALLGIYLLLGVLPLVVLDDRARARPVTDALAWIVLAALTFLIGATRPEVAGFGLGALLVATARLAFGDAALADRWRRLGAWAVSPRRWSAWQVVALGALVLIAWLEPPDAPTFGRFGWFVHGLHPRGDHTFPLPLVLTSLVPAGVVVLGVVALVGAIRSPFRGFLAPVALLLVLRIYMVASHGVLFERNRYGAYIVVPLILVAALGWRELMGFARQRGWSSRPVALGIGVLLLIPPLDPAAGTLQADGRAAHTLDPLGWPVRTEQQAEVQFLLAARERWPDCALVTRVTVSNGGLDRGGPPHSWILLAERRLEPIADPEEAPYACVLVYRGLDCGLATSDGCEGLGGEALMEAVVAPTPYNDPEYGVYRDEIRLGVYALRGP